MTIKLSFKYTDQVLQDLGRGPQHLFWLKSPSFMDLSLPTSPAPMRSLACRLLAVYRAVTKGKDIPWFLPTGLTHTVCAKQLHHQISTLSRHGKVHDITTVQRLEVSNTTGHQYVRGSGDIIAVLHKTHQRSLLRPSWEREISLQHSRHQIIRHWAGESDKHRQNNSLSRRMRIDAAQSELVTDNV